MKIKLKNGMLLILSVIVSIILFELFSRVYYTVSSDPSIQFIGENEFSSGSVDFVILGDSVCAGLFIEEENSYAYLLKKHLSAFDVKILCHSGADILDYYAAFNEFSTKYKPKNIILLITMYNDFQNRGFYVFGKDLISIDTSAQYSLKTNIITKSKFLHFSLGHLKSLYFTISKGGIILYKLQDHFNVKTPYIYHKPESYNNKIDYNSNLKLLVF